MRVRALFTDYDGTLAALDQPLQPKVVDCMRALKANGTKLILVTGKTQAKVHEAIPDSAVLQLFDFVVLESGGIIWKPSASDNSLQLLGRPISPQFLSELAASGIAPLDVGRTMVCIDHRNVARVDAIAQELGISFGKVVAGSVQYGTPGVCKSACMPTVLAMLGINARDALAVGDGPNDVDMLDKTLNGGVFGVAVANAVPETKVIAGHILKGEAGDGFCELVGTISRGQLVFSNQSALT
jgi:hydroxymethylpyrimidine pyrophosphatase-like HAD family hydrolase